MKGKFSAKVCITGLVLILCVTIPQMIKAFRNVETRYSNSEQIFEYREKIKQVEETLETEGWDMDKTRKEEITPWSWSDKKGHEINFYQYNFSNMDCGEGEPAIHRIFDPGTADSSTACKVNDLDATVYEKGKYSYLWWAPSDHTILLIQYEPAIIPDSEIIKMAESTVAYVKKEDPEAASK